METKTSCRAGESLGIWNALSKIACNFNPLHQCLFGIHHERCANYNCADFVFYRAELLSSLFQSGQEISNQHLVNPSKSVLVWTNQNQINQYLNDSVNQQRMYDPKKQSPSHSIELYYHSHLDTLLIICLFNFPALLY